MALGLGIALPTVLFCFAYGALRPLPVPDGHRIVHLEHANPAQGLEELDVSIHDYLDWGSAQSALQDMAAFYRGTVNLSGGDRPERYFGAFVTANALDVLEVRPALGRGFLTGEDHPAAERVALVSHAVWRSRFNARPDVVGSVVRVNGIPTTVVGVLPEGFGFPYWDDVWLPLRIDAADLGRGEGPGLEVFGRLRDEVTLTQAQAEFRGIGSRLASRWPDTNRGLVPVVEEYTASYHEQDSDVALVFLLLTGLAVLLIASFNVTNLLLARAVSRTRDLAIRVAVGASRRRVVASLLYETSLIALGGAVLGTLMTVVAVAVIHRLIVDAATYPPPFWMEFKVDAPILLFVLVLTAVGTLASGLIPALKVSRVDVHGLLQDASRGATSLGISRVSRVLVLGELTVSVMLLVAAGHVMEELHSMRKADYGYPVDEVLTARVGLFDAVVPDREGRLSFYRDLQGRLGDRSEVVSVALATTLPGQTAPTVTVRAEGASYPRAVGAPPARVASVSPAFFRAFDVVLDAGRDFTPADEADAMPVAIVNRSFAERFFPGEDPVGRRIRLGASDEETPWRTVVGVAPDLNMDGALEPEGTPQGVYVPIVQSDAHFVSIAVRGRGDPMALAPAIREEVLALQEDTPVYFVRTLRDAVNTNLLDTLLGGGLFVSFGAAAFFLAVVGLYGVTAFLASRRRREVGVRMALGARSSAVLGLVFRRGYRQVVLGLAAGVLLAALAREGMRGLGAGVTDWNLGVTLVVCGVLGVTSLAAVLIPAWRSSRVDPVLALQSD
jgi:putative ABC transport system permease protein